jgi:hypothetical protein
VSNDRMSLNYNLVKAWEDVVVDLQYFPSIYLQELRENHEKQSVWLVFMLRIKLSTSKI